MMMARFAEEANYWNTTVHPAKSQAEIIELLEDFGAANLMVAQGQANGRLAWLVRFEWQGASYRFTFIPLECKDADKTSSFGGKRRSHGEQARYQMGRIAVHFVKALLTAAEAHPHALFGFIELPEAGMHPGGLPVTAGALDASGLASALPPLEVGSPVHLLPKGKGCGAFTLFPSSSFFRVARLFEWIEANTQANLHFWVAQGVLPAEVLEE